MVIRVTFAIALSILFLWGAHAPAGTKQQGTLIVALDTLGAQTMDPILETRAPMPRSALVTGAAGFIGGRRVPVLGRISMDLTAFDVTDLGEDAVSPGDMIELFGPNIPLDEAARAAGTISYEMLTSIGRRYHRVYVSGGELAV
jgi:hypothetical protein